VGVATILYMNEQPPELTGNESIAQLIIYKRLASKTLKCFKEIRERSYTWPNGDKWMRFFMHCDSRISYLRRPEPRGEDMGYIC